MSGKERKSEREAFSITSVGCRFTPAHLAPSLKLQMPRRDETKIRVNTYQPYRPLEIP